MLLPMSEDADLGSAIGLPAQSIGVDKGDVPVTRRNQTLDDLFVQSKHYSAATRKGTYSLPSWTDPV